MNKSYSILLAILLLACGSRESVVDSRESVADSLESIVNSQQSAMPADAPRKTLSPQIVSIDSSFWKFYSGFQKAFKGGNKKTIAGFMAFPFDEQGGSWTREEFLQAFEITKELQHLVKSIKPRRHSSTEYRLMGEDTGLIFLKHPKGKWQWTELQYAH